MENIKQNEMAINQVLKNLAEAWKTADAKLFSEQFSPDADYVTFNGDHLKGRESIAKSHHELWKFLKGSTLVSSGNPEIRFVTENLAIVHGKGAVLMKHQKEISKSRLSINTNVFVQTNGHWEITAFHNCRITKMPWFIRLMMKLQK